MNLKGLEYSIKPVHLVKNGGEQHQSEFEAINPGKKVPVLEHMGEHISQSMAIIEYIDHSFPDPLLFPRERWQKAMVRQLCEVINTDIQPIQNLSVLQMLTKTFNATDEQKIAWVKHWITQGFKTYEKLIEDCSGNYSFGDNFTAADCFLVPQVYNANRFGVNMLQFPKITRINDNCLENEAFQMAHPDNQPDTPRKV